MWVYVPCCRADFTVLILSKTYNRRDAKRTVWQVFPLFQGGNSALLPDSMKKSTTDCQAFVKEKWN